MSLLSVEGLRKSFGALEVLRGVDFSLEAGEVMGVIGPNGSGKTTMFDCMAGVLETGEGRVLLEGRILTGLSAHRICRLGLVKTDQVDHTFSEMTVEDNVLLGAMFGGGLGQGAAAERVEEVLRLVGLSAEKNQLAASLTVASRRRLALARALATDPKVMLLDENLAGLTPAETDVALDILRAIHLRGVALIMVEHVMRAVLGICQRLMVLDFGKVIASGSPQKVLSQPQVAEAYLGEGYAA